jgi:alanine racemase
MQHVPYIELSKSALAHNISLFKQLIGDHALACVIKGNAYGHGSAQLVELTRNHPAITYFATATLSEALMVRAQGVSKPILVMSFVDQDPELAVLHAVDLVLYAYRDIARFAAAAAHVQRPLYLHIKIDTGLARFGFLPAELPTVLDQLAQYPLLKVRGLMSHCAQADAEDATYTRVQIAQFNACLDLLLMRGLQVPYLHMHATAALLKYGMQRTTMVRLGAGLYGMSSSPVQFTQLLARGIDVRQLLTFKTVIIAERWLPAGTHVGYGSTYVTTRATRSAVIAAGYCHGYQRRASNTASVLVHGQYAAVIGRVTMNTTTIDITDIPEAQIGSEVILYGDYPGVRMTDFAETIGCFNPREVAVGLAADVPRIIVP